MGTWDRWVWPLPVYLDEKPVISSGYSDNLVERDGKWVPKHLGADIMYRRPAAGDELLPWVTRWHEMWPSVPVLAVGPGDVWGVTKNKKGSNIVIIDHHKVPGYGPLASMYGHLADDIRVKKGDHVEAGKVLGFVGHTGTSIAHLHFALSTDVKKKWQVNPATLLSQWRMARVESSPPTTPTPVGPEQPEPVVQKPEPEPEPEGNLWLLLLLLLMLSRE